MEEFREIHFEGAMLRVYRNGEIWRWKNKQGPNKIFNPYWKLCGTLSNGYYVIRFKNKAYLNHRIIAMVYLDLDINNITIEVDHIDRCGANNNINNLRLVNSQQNKFNTNRKGYGFRKDCNKWRVRLKVSNKYVYSKYHENEEDAAADYIKQKKIYHKIE